MSIPDSFESAEEYFTSCLELFQRLQHLYKHPNTKVLTLGSLEAIPSDGLAELDIFDDPTSLEAVRSVNGDVKQMFDDIERLTVDYGEVAGQSEPLGVPVGFKKKHEIVLLAREIDDVCRRTGCNTVVDFGSGLGYLDQLIHAKFDYNVLGLECNAQHYANAKKRQRRYHQNSYDKVKYVKHTISEQSDAGIERYVREKFKDSDRLCIAGLHACADLTIDAMSLFFKMADAKSMVLMSCCYHKMAACGGGFKNFPISSVLKALCADCGAEEFLTVAFLRLAAQPCSSEESLRTLVFNLLGRGLLQFYADKHNYKMKRRKRKPINTKSIDGDFDSYLRQSSTAFALTCGSELCLSDELENRPDKGCQCNLDFDLEELRKIWRQFTDLTFKKAAIFVLLQRRLQPVFENFVLLDRIVYLKENGSVDCKMKKIVNEKISPRCLAMLITK